MRSVAGLITFGLVLPAFGKRDIKKRSLTRQSLPDDADPPRSNNGGMSVGDDGDPATGYDHFDHFGHPGAGKQMHIGSTYDYYEWVLDESDTANRADSGGNPGSRKAIKQQKGKRAKTAVKRNIHDQYQYGYGYGYDEDYDQGEEFHLAPAEASQPVPQVAPIPDPPHSIADGSTAQGGHGIHDHELDGPTTRKKKAGLVRKGGQNKEDKYQYGYGYGYDDDYYAGAPKPDGYQPTQARRLAKRMAKSRMANKPVAKEHVPASYMMIGCIAALAAVAAVAAWIVHQRPTAVGDSAYGTIKTDDLLVSV